jgi:hypothetical protein
MDIPGRSKASRAQAFREALSREPAFQDNVMRDGDSISLVGRLPWWRNDRMQPITYGSEEAESQVMAAADAWLLANAQIDTKNTSPDESLRTSIVNADLRDVRAPDAASADPVVSSAPPPVPPTISHSLTAILAGVAAAIAVAVATARLLFA